MGQDLSGSFASCEIRQVVPVHKLRDDSQTDGGTEHKIITSSFPCFSPFVFKYV